MCTQPLLDVADVSIVVQTYQLHTHPFQLSSCFCPRLWGVCVGVGGGEPICTSLLFPSVGKVLNHPGKRQNLATEFNYSPKGDGEEMVGASRGAWMLLPGEVIPLGKWKPCYLICLGALFLLKMG